MREGNTHQSIHHVHDMVAQLVFLLAAASDPPSCLDLTRNWQLSKLVPWYYTDYR
jgi:hypothetical protein